MSHPLPDSPEQRVLHPIPTRELERRWRAVRERMDELGIDALVMQNSNDWLGGYVKWFTDRPATNAYPRAIVFPRDGRMVSVEQGPTGGIREVPPDDVVDRGVEKIVFTPSYASIHYTGTYDAELVQAELRRRGYKTVGLVGTACMYHDFCAHLKQTAGSVRFVDATDMVDHIKAIKSADEIEAIGRMAAMQDEVLQALARHIRPGMKDFEVAAYAQYAGQLRGSEQGLFIGSSSPAGRAAMYKPRHLQGREMREGDSFTLLIENNGPGGYYGELARTFVLGKASQELLDTMALLVEAQRHTLDHLKPGAMPADILAAHNAFMRARGMREETRLYAHGQGYDMVERPLIREDETMPIAAGMNIVVHPGHATPSVFTTVCDNYIIGADGPGECLHKTPKTIIEL
ncbi:aminopeptidase P family protein [Pigmentiphaga sp. H8]|uniref:M24 family metallopeptidase n=1 Tax=unclassified Pigmentiphaga TaxID=2626614 RepID=UPI000F59CBAF|nr:M24 family metallopeptidase [Pigmentiphaga sp. H8]AZG06989.1 aminopeptidase P family protein [Pigmentiphaga sp. H8]